MGNCQPGLLFRGEMSRRLVPGAVGRRCRACPRLPLQRREHWPQQSPLLKEHSVLTLWCKTKERRYKPDRDKEELVRGRRGWIQTAKTIPVCSIQRKDFKNKSSLMSFPHSGWCLAVNTPAAPPDAESSPFSLWESTC